MKLDRSIETVVAGARTALSGTGALNRPRAEAPPRFELFHAAASICSQKVRAVLAHHKIPYREHPLNIFAGDTYLPGYVRLRMLGCDRYGGALVAEHGGSTSTAAGGCDGAVVPTLVDWDGEAVVVDSKRICIHLDDQVADADRLRPLALVKAIDCDLDVIDNLPNYQMLMGRARKEGESARTQGNVGNALSLKKVAWCDRYLNEHPDEPALVAAYTAKRSKELWAAERLFSPEAMKAAFEHIEATLTALERRLATIPTRWLHGNQPTMADLFWAIELLRMENTGMSKVWEGGRLPHVAEYAANAGSIPAIGSAILDWPDALF